ASCFLVSGVFTLLFKKFYSQLPEFVFLNLPACSQGIFIHDEDMLGNLITGDLAYSIIPYVSFGKVCVLFENYKSSYNFSVFLVRNSHNLDVFYSGYGVKEFFNFPGVNVFTSPDDHVFNPACDPVIAVLITG